MVKFIALASLAAVYAIPTERLVEEEAETEIDPRMFENMDPMIMTAFLDKDGDNQDIMDMVVLNSMAKGQDGQGNQMSPFMLKMLMNKDGDAAGNDKFFKLMAMQQMSDPNNQQGMSPWMLSLLFDQDGNQDIDPMMLYLMMGQNGQNLFQAEEQGQMNPLMMSMLMGDGGMDKDMLLNLMMFDGNQNGENGGMNPMMLMMLMDDKKKADAGADASAKV